MRLPFLAPFALVLAGCHCGPSAESVARARAANEFHCPLSEVTSKVVSDPTIRVDACGHYPTYTCPASYYGRLGNFDRTCIREPDQD